VISFVSVNEHKAGEVCEKAGNNFEKYVCSLCWIHIFILVMAPWTWVRVL